jgi:hypothetical protein
MRLAYTFTRHFRVGGNPFLHAFITIINQTNIVIPAEAGIQARWYSRIVVYFKIASIHVAWIPACAGMTVVEGFGVNT